MGPSILSGPAIWAVLPAKDLAGAKQRLAGVLSATERRELFAAMLEDVLSALAASVGLAGILMVTRDPLAGRLGAGYGARILLEEENRGHSAASTLGAGTLAREGTAGMVQVPADIPLLAPDEVAALLRAHEEDPAVTLSPSRDGRGTNAVVCSPPDLLPLCFGDDSFSPHLERARSIGIEPQIVRRPGLALDIDTPDDLAAFLATPSPTRAFAYLAGSGIAERLRLRTPGWRWGRARPAPRTSGTNGGEP